MVSVDCWDLSYMVCGSQILSSMTTGVGAAPGKYSYYNNDDADHVNTVMHEVGHSK